MSLCPMRPPTGALWGDREPPKGFPPEPPWTDELPRAWRTPPPWNRCPDLAVQDPGGKMIRGQNSAVPRKARALALTGRCEVCGCIVDGPGYSIWWEWSHVELPGGLWAAAPSSVCHKSCAVYSAMVCPVLRTARAHWKYDPPRPGGRTGPPPRGRAAILAWQHYGVATAGGRWWLATWDCRERIDYNHGSELADHYAAALDTDQVDTRTRKCWHQQESLLAVDLARAENAVPLRLVSVGGEPYRLRQVR